MEKCGCGCGGEKMEVGLRGKVVDWYVDERKWGERGKLVEEEREWGGGTTKRQTFLNLNYEREFFYIHIK